MSERRVIVVGDALVDEIDGLAIAGGAALNVAVGLSRLGVPAALAAMVGDDEPGAMLRAHCIEHGVELIATPAPHGTAVATATREGGSMRYEFNETGIARFVDLEAAADRLETAELVVASCIALECEAQVAPLASLGGRLLIDPNARPSYLSQPGAAWRFRAGLEALAPTALLLKLSDEDVELVGVGDADSYAESLVALGARAVCVTRGPEGAAIVTADGWVRAGVPHLREPIVDTIGAGDSVLATLTAAVLRGEHREGWLAPLQHAMHVAAATTRAPGGLLQSPGNRAGV